MADVADNEELIATRKLHGLDDGLFEEDEKIKVGEYVRTDKGEIAKVTSVAKEALKEILGANEYRNVEFCNTEPYVYGNIVKHSKQLIDLIEVKDLICFKNTLSSNTLENEEMIIHIFNNETLQEVKQAIEDEEIKIISILTKESYMVNCYKAGGEDE